MIQRMSYFKLIYLLLLLILANQYTLFRKPNYIKFGNHESNLNQIVLSPAGDHALIITKSKTEATIESYSVGDSGVAQPLSIQQFNCPSSSIAGVFWLSSEYLLLIFSKMICLQPISKIVFSSNQQISQFQMSQTICIDDILLQQNIMSPKLIQKQGKIRLLVIVNQEYLNQYSLDGGFIEKIHSVAFHTELPLLIYKFYIYQLEHYYAVIIQDYAYHNNQAQLISFSTNTSLAYDLGTSFIKAVALDGYLIFEYVKPNKLVQMFRAIFEFDGVSPINCTLSQLSIVSPNDTNANILSFYGYEDNLFIMKNVTGSMYLAIFCLYGDNLYNYQIIPFNQSVWFYIVGLANRIVFTSGGLKKDEIMVFSKIQKQSLALVIPLIYFGVICILIVVPVALFMIERKHYLFTYFRNNFFQFLSLLTVYSVITIHLFLHDTNHYELFKPNSQFPTTFNSYYTRILYYIFLMNFLISIINENNYQSDYKSSHLRMATEHGLNIRYFIILRMSMLMQKAIFCSICAVVYIYYLQLSYSDQFARVFTSVAELITLGYVYSISLFTLLVFSIFIHQVVSSYWYSLQIIVALNLWISFNLQMSFKQSTIKSIELILSVTSPLANFYEIIECKFLTKQRTANFNQYLDLNDLLIAHFILMVVAIAAFFGLLIQRFNKVGLKSLIKSKRLNDSILSSLNSVEGKEIDNHLLQDSDDPLLSVFIPCKLTINKGLQKKKILENIKFTANRNEIITFIDYPNISKSVLFKILINQQESDSFIQRDLQGYIIYTQSIKLSYCFDKNVYYGALSAVDHLQFYLKLKDRTVSRQHAKKQIDYFLNQFCIPEQESVKPSQFLSGGYLKKMLLACAFIGNPDVIIIDEPTLGLDVRFKKIFWQKLTKWKQNRLIIIGTSDDEEVDIVSDRIWTFNHGKIYDFLSHQKKKIFHLTFDLFNQDQLQKGTKMIENYIKKGVITNLGHQNASDKYKIIVQIYDISSQHITDKLIELIKQMDSFFGRDYYFYFKMVQSKISMKDYYEYFNNQCNHCDREQIVRAFHEQLVELKQMEQPHEMNLNQNHQNQFHREAESLLKSLEVSDSSQTAYSQIKAILYQRLMVVHNLQLVQTELLIIMIYFWLHSITIFLLPEQDNYESWRSFTKMFTIYTFLHLHFLEVDLIDQKAQQHLKALGLRIQYYWIAQMAFNALYVLLPFLFNLVLFFLVRLFIFMKFQQNYPYIILGYPFYLLNYTIWLLILSLIIKSKTNFILASVLFFIFPLYIGQDTFLASYPINNSAVDPILDFMYFPYSLFNVFDNENEDKQLSGLNFVGVLVYESIISIAIFIMLLKLKQKWKQNRQRINVEEIKNVTNQFIRQQQAYISDLSTKTEFIIAQNIAKQYRTHFALRNIYLHCKRGEVLAILGHNGCGKTTLFNIISNYQSQTIGSLSYFDQNTQHQNRIKLQIGYCAQIDNLYDELTVEQNIRLVGMIKGLKDRYITILIIKFLRYFQLKDHERIKVKYLTEDSRKKISLISTFIGYPKILIFDEPTTGLDQISRIKAMNLIRTYTSIYKSSTIITSHNISQAEPFCDRITILKKGIIKKCGTPFSMITHPSQQLFRLIIYLSAGESQILLQKKKRLVQSYVKSLNFVSVISEEKWRLVYSLDMVNLSMKDVFVKFMGQFFKEGIIDKFCLFKHDLEEVVRSVMSESQQSEQNSEIKKQMINN